MDCTTAYAIVVAGVVAPLLAFFFFALAYYGIKRIFGADDDT